MSPRTGRPTEDPKRKNMLFRLSQNDADKLEYCCDVLGLGKSEVIRLALDKLYQAELKKRNKK